MGFQSHESLNFENFGTLNLGVLGQNDIWVQAQWACIDNTIRGKMVAPPSPSCGESCESVFAHASLVHQKCSNYALTNLLFDLCKSKWIIDPLVIHPSPISKPNTPLYPKVLQSKEHTPTLYHSTIFTFGFVVESIKKFWGASKLDRRGFIDQIYS
jgi:hypothetical protein